ncbi:MAG: hypothetical protein R2932_17615 [Caldilineaceae bacterium]
MSDGWHTFTGAGNSSPTAEFNIRQDPAAAMVLESGLPIRLYTLDVFRDIQLACQILTSSGPPALITVTWRASGGFSTMSVTISTIMG